MTKFSIDNSGQIVGLSHHDGRIRSVGIESDALSLRIVGSSGNEAVVLLAGVQYFALNNLREGNIIDRMYLWELNKTPSAIMKRMLHAMSIASSEVLLKKFASGIRVFHLECSYGAEIFAVVDQVQIETLPISS